MGIIQTTNYEGSITKAVGKAHALTCDIHGKSDFGVLVFYLWDVLNG